jgi:hypothetical protein
MKDDYASLPFVIPSQKVEFPTKKSMDNQQVSLLAQVVKISKFVNVQHVLELVELDDFDIEKIKVAER